MTREEAKELMPFIQAFVEGKTVEFLNNNGRWEESDDILFCREPKYYRIKQDPKYRPFRTQEECWNEMHKHPDFGWLYYKEKGYYVNINAMGDRVGMNGQKFVEAYSDYTFTDGEPFGVKEE